MWTVHLHVGTFPDIDSYVRERVPDWQELYRASLLQSVSEALSHTLRGEWVVATLTFAHHVGHYHVQAECRWNDAVVTIPLAVCVDRAIHDVYTEAASHEAIPYTPTDM